MGERATSKSSLMNDLTIEALGEVSSFALGPDKLPTRETIEAYRADGVVCLRNAFGPDWLAVLESGIERSMDTATSGNGYSDKIAQEGDDGFFFYDQMMWRHIEPFRKFVFDSHVPDVIKRLLETDSLIFYYDFLLIKTAGCYSGETPWHQDHSYYPLHGRQIVNCWVALDRIPKETSLRFVRGSQVPDQVYRQVSFNPDLPYENLSDELVLPPDFDADPEEYVVITCDLAPGDTLVWNSRMFHSAPGNHLDTRRGAHSSSWLGDDVTYHDVSHQIQPPERGENLREGGPMECESFPRVR